MASASPVLYPKGFKCEKVGEGDCIDLAVGARGESGDAGVDEGGRVRHHPHHAALPGQQLKDKSRHQTWLAYEAYSRIRGCEW